MSDDFNRKVEELLDLKARGEEIAGRQSSLRRRRDRVEREATQLKEEYEQNKKGMEEVETRLREIAEEVGYDWDAGKMKETPDESGS